MPSTPRCCVGRERRCGARRRGVLEWPGQLLLKGKDDAVQIKLVGPKQEEAPAPPPPEPPKEEPVAEEEAAPAAEVEIS